MDTHAVLTPHLPGKFSTTPPPYGAGGVLVRLWLATVTRYQDDGGLKQYRK